jgi:hypothetical protein
MQPHGSFQPHMIARLLCHTDSPIKARATTSPLSRSAGPAAASISSALSSGGAGGLVYVAEGPGLDLCLPNKATTFIVKSAGNRKILKVLPLCRRKTAVAKTPAWYLCGALHWRLHVTVPSLQRCNRATHGQSFRKKVQKQGS